MKHFLWEYFIKKSTSLIRDVLNCEIRTKRSCMMPYYEVGEKKDKSKQNDTVLLFDQDRLKGDNRI